MTRAADVDPVQVRGAGAASERYVVIGSLAAALSEALARRFAAHRLAVRVAGSGADFQRLAHAPGATLAVLGGSDRPGADGLGWVYDEAPATSSAIPKVLIDSCGSKERAVRALRLGFADYLDWPSAIDEVWKVVRRQITEPVPALRVAAAEVGSILFASASMRAAIEYARRVAATDCSVLITGETGTGKELFADLVHAESARRARPLLRLNCAALPEQMVEAELFGYQRGAFTGASQPFPGRFVLADSGTLFLDEIGDLSLTAQAKVLRALESGELTPLGCKGTRRVDIRVVAATNQPLEELVAAKRFRADLFFRLNVARLEIPPLRARSEDIPLLFHHFLRHYAARSSRPAPAVHPDLLCALLAYDWPGNVRELRNLVEATLLRGAGAALTADDLPERLRRAGAAAGDPGEEERRRLVGALLQTKWNKSDAARLLKCSRMTLYRKMQKHRIEAAP